VELVDTVIVEVCALVVLKVSEDEERLQVAGLVALVGEVVSAQASATVPVKELPGVTVMVEVPVEPGLTEMLPLLARVKLVLVLVGASQKPAHPDSSGAASNINANFSIFIAAPLCSPVSSSTRNFSID
jgi:hypothetical protein